MAWERRRGGLFYYRSVRVQRAVRKVYFGRAAAAVAQARRDAEARRRRAAERQALGALQARVAAAERALQEARSLVTVLAAAALILDGCHLHRAQWRRRRRRARCKEEGGPEAATG
jgi:hypothetical protein